LIDAPEDLPPDIKRQQWTCFGHSVGVDGPQPFIDELQRLVPPTAWRPGSGAERYWRVRATAHGYRGEAGGAAFGCWDSPEAAARAVRSDIELWAGERCRDPVVIHAAVVAIDGKAIVMPGPSGVGKTTLTIALVQAGALYMSDEFALLDRHGWVHPYPRLLSIREASDSSVIHHVAVEELGGSTAAAPAPVGLIAALVYDPSCNLPRLAEAPPTMVALSLIGNALAARTHHDAVLEASTRSSENSIGITGSRGSTDIASQRLRLLLRSSASSAVHLHPAPICSTSSRRDQHAVPCAPQATGASQSC
jgi:hypothetical protein